ncbi:hypothetical protein [Streptomyces boluensis]|uniref:Uncharacterized protein n=1 Tax=Streptomyces boluensis TaxID=1775135 RepID=A0A964UU74_9ACTN|nr:hypothetical protein [Streptomyces boluensis]NBE54792.1 hypothetical protein [Streptomyces boluensis]
MPKTSSSVTAAPATTWLGHGRHLGPSPEQDVRRNLIALKAAGVIDDYLDLAPADTSAAEVGGMPDPFESEDTAPPEPTARRVFEARWRVDEDITVRAQLTTYDSAGRRRDDAVVGWVLAAEAERTWDLEWLSPATVFWPDVDSTAWDHDTVPGPRLRAPNALPEDDKEMRRLLKSCARQSWNIHVVVHEAMTPDTLGRRSLTAFLPPGLRHRVVEHRASPEQLHIVNHAIKDLDVRVPRGGAVVLPTSPSNSAYDADAFAVRSVFLDGSEPTELVEKITAFAGLPRSLSPDAARAVEQLRQRWHLLTVEEELARTRELVTKYADALDAMTKSRDLYREAAERAQAALAEGPGAGPVPPLPTDPSVKQDGSPFSTLTTALGRFRDVSKQRPRK